MEKLWPKRLLIVLVVTAAFARLGFHEFTGWDDPATIYGNPSFNPPRLANLAWYWTAWDERASMGLYVPVTYTFWGLLAKIAYLQNADPLGIRLNPFVYHSANVILHVLGALVAFELLRRLLDNAWAACAGALLWGLHPVQVEPVGWASGTKDVLCGLLGLVALWQYVMFAREPRDHSKWRRGAHYLMAMMALVGAILSKPSGLVVPIMAIVIDRLYLHRPLSRSAAALAPWFLLSLPIVYLTKLTQSTYGMEPGPLWRRALVAADALAFYLWKLVWPLNLSADYGRTPARIIEEGWILYTWVVPVVIVGLLVTFSRRARTLVAAASIFVIGVLPVLGFLPFQFQFYSTVADHYLYLAMLGPALGLAWAVDRWPIPIIGVACATLLAALGIRSFDQAKYWYDDITLFTRAMTVNPRSFVAHNNIGSALWARRERGAAEWHFRKAIEIYPDYPSGHDNLAIALIYRGDTEEAVEHIATVLRVYHDKPAALRPNIEQTHTLFGRYLLARGRFDEAIEQFRAALKVKPDHAPARESLALTLEQRRASAATRSATRESR
jgi:Flp pilus assembly protein TadD